MQKQQAKELEETAVMLMQALQEVFACIPFFHVGQVPFIMCYLADLGFQ